MFLGVLVSLTMPLASVAAGCKRVPKVSVSSKGFEHKWKGDIICVPFLQQNNIPKSVFRMSRSFYHSNLDTLPTVAGSALTLLTRRYHKNRGSMMSLELFAINCWDLGQVGQICWCHSGDLYAFGHVMCNMPATLVGFSPWCHSLMVVFFTSSCWICYCYSPVGGTVKWWRRPEKLCGVARCSDLQNCSAMMDVRIFHCHCRIPHFMISSFVVALCGFNSKVHSKVWDWCWQIFCGQLVSLILWNDGGIPQLSLWTIWTSQVSGSYERSEYGTFLWLPFCGIYGYIKTVDAVMSHEGSTVSLLFCD
jgi:hypothetical protein